MKRTPLQWLRITGRVLIGRHEDPVEQIEEPSSEETRVFLGSQPPPSGRKAASLQIHSTSRIKVGQTKAGLKLHIFVPGADHQSFFCGAGGAARSRVHVVNTINSDVCKTCLKLRGSL